MSNISSMAHAATIGDNNPPEPTPFEQSAQEIEELYVEAEGWLDGVKIETKGQADGISLLMDLIRTAEKKAEERRKAEAKPFDDGKAEVQARYNPLIQKDKGKCALALAACKAALKPWLEKLDAEQREIARKAREEADRQREEAQAALRASQADNLAERAAAEARLREADRAEREAKNAEKQKAHAEGGRRAVGLRTTYRPELIDARAAAAHYWSHARREMEEFLLQLAKEDVRAGTRTIPGFNVIEERAL